jgi:hypothetical protein
MPKGSIGGCLGLARTRPRLETRSAACPDPPPAAQHRDFAEQGWRKIDAVEPGHIGFRVDAVQVCRRLRPASW